MLWPLGLPSLAMSLFVLFLLPILGVLLQSLLFSVYEMYSFFLVPGSRWGRWWLRMQWFDRVLFGVG